MKVEIYEKAEFKSSESDLDVMLDYTVRSLREHGVEVVRYEKSECPEETFEKVKGYALPVIIVDDEILCAGAYDFTLLENWKLNKSLNDSEERQQAGCQQGCSSSKCAGCQYGGNCPNRAN